MKSRTSAEDTTGCELGVETVLLDNQACTAMLKTFIFEHLELWHEDIGL